MANTIRLGSKPTIAALRRDFGGGGGGGGGGCRL